MPLPNSTAPPNRRDFWLAVLSGLAAASIWGGWPAISRLGMRSELDVFDLTAIRYTVAGLILLPALWRLGLAPAAPANEQPNSSATTEPRVRARTAWPALALLVCGAGAPYLLLAAGGLNFAPAAHFGVIGPSTMLLVTSFFGWLWQGDRFDLPRLGGMSLILAGIGVMGVDGLRGGSVPDGSRVAFGDLLFVLAGLAWAAYTLSARQWRFSALHSIAIVGVGSLALYTPLYLTWHAVFGDGLPALYAKYLSESGHVLFQALFQGVLSAFLALFLYTRAVGVLGAARGAVFAALVPGAATLLAIPLLNEWPGELERLGVLLVTIGMCFALGLIGRVRRG